MNKSTIAAFANYEQQHPGFTVLTCSNHQIEVLQEFVLLNAPVEDAESLEADSGRRDLWRAITMVQSLINPKAPGQTTELLLEYVTRDHANGPTEHPFFVATRGFEIYQLNIGPKTRDAQWIADQFSALSEVQYSEYLLGGIVTLLCDKNQGPDSHSQGWYPILRPNDCNNPREAACRSAFYGMRCTTVAVLKECTASYEKSPDDLASYSLIPIRKYPIIDFSERGIFINNYDNLGQAIIDAPRHALIDAAKGCGKKVEEVGGKLGKVFEQYIHKVLQATYTSAFHRINQDGHADFLVFDKHHALVIEAKMARFHAGEHLKLLTLDKRKKELLRDIGKANRQIANTITSLWNGTSFSDPFGVRDWTTTHIVPIVVTWERVPLVWLREKLFDTVESPVNDLPKRGQVAAVRYLTARDVESLWGLQGNKSIGQLFATWSNEPNTKDRPFYEFLRGEGVKPSQEWLKRLSEGLKKYIVSCLGLASGNNAEP